MTLILITLYTLIAFIATIFVISITCSVENQPAMNDSDLVWYVILSVCAGLLWPLTIAYVFLFTFAKNVYLRSVQKEEEKLSELQAEQEKLKYEEDMGRARSAIINRGE